MPVTLAIDEVVARLELRALCAGIGARVVCCAAAVAGRFGGCMLAMVRDGLRTISGAFAAFWRTERSVSDSVEPEKNNKLWLVVASQIANWP